MHAFKVLGLQDTFSLSDASSNVGQKRLLCQLQKAAHHAQLFPVPTILILGD